MVKRKREPCAQRDEPPEHGLRTQRIEIEKKVVHGKKRVNHVLKTAKGFERQKLARRIAKAKSGISDADCVGRLEREVAALKSLDIAAAAESHLCKTLVKSKDIVASGTLPSYVEQITGATAQQDSGLEALAKNNVSARLYNAKSVKDEICAVLEGIRDALGLSVPQRSRNGAKSTKTQERRSSETLSHQGASKAAKSDQKGSKWNGLRSADSTQKATARGVVDGDDIEGDNGDNAHSFYSKFKDRLASSSDTDEDADDNDKITPPIASADPDQQVYDPVVELSISPPPSHESSPSPPPTKSRGQKVAGQTKDSTFLPSLMGGYWSGSESAEDIDDQPRKNRRGQRARRQIWEQKFGAKANHLKKKSKEDWDPRRGAKGALTGGPFEGKGHWKGSANRQPGRATGANTTVQTMRPSKSDVQEGKLHPSWEAAKRANAEKRKATFQGKKVVFD